LQIAGAAAFLFGAVGFSVGALNFLGVQLAFDSCKSRVQLPSSLVQLAFGTVK
jgi:hypothetical protein